MMLLGLFADGLQGAALHAHGQGTAIWDKEASPPLSQAPDPPDTGIQHLPVGGRTGCGPSPLLSAGPILGSRVKGQTLP